MVPEESVGNVVFWVNGVHQRVCVDAHARSVDHDFVDLGKTLQEELHARPDQHKHLDGPAFHNDPHLEVRLAPGATSLHLGERELAVNKGFIQVEHQSFASFEFGHLPRDHCVLKWDGLLPETPCSCQLLHDFRAEI